MNKAQVTLDLLVAILISIFLFTWLQSFVQIQTQGTQKLGMKRETAQKAIAIGSVTNAFQAMEPSSNDYAEQINPDMKNYLRKANSTVEKSTGNNEIKVTGEYAEETVNYTYPVPFPIEYSDSCTQIGGDPCVGK